MSEREGRAFATGNPPSGMRATVISWPPMASHPVQPETRVGAGPVRVSDVLALESFAAAGISVVAGHENLERPVAWVHAGEIPDIAVFLRGGELLLTAGTGIGRSASEQQRYIAALASAGASALVLELGRAFSSAPPALVEAAEAAGLPLAILKETVPFAEVTRSVHAWILGRQFETQTRAERIAFEFNDLLHDVTGKPSLLEDSAHQLVEYAGSDAEFEAAIADWRSHSRAGHRERVAGEAIGRTDAVSGCAWAPVVLRGQDMGRVHVLASGGPCDELHLLAVARAAAAVGLALLARREDDRLAERARADLLAEAARRSPTDPATFLRQARGLGADLRGCDLVAVVIPDEESAGARAIEGAAKALQRLGLPYIASTDALLCRVLIGVPRVDAPRATPRDLVDAILAHSGADELIAGISRTASVPQIPRAFREAEECLRYARLRHASGVLEYDALGLHLLLVPLSDGPDLASYVEAQLGLLLAYDAEARSPLLPTLRALLENDNNRAETARALYVERRSVYYRLLRIETVLGKKLDDYETKLALGVALRGLSLIEDRSVTSTSARRAAAAVSRSAH